MSVVSGTEDGPAPAADVLASVADGPACGGDGRGGGGRGGGA